MGLSNSLLLLLLFLSKKIDEAAFIQFVCKEWQRPHGNEQAFLELLHCAFTVFKNKKDG